MKLNHLSTKKVHFSFSNNKQSSKNHLSRKKSFAFKINCYKKLTKQQQLDLHFFIKKQLLKKQLLKSCFFFNFVNTVTKLPSESRMGKGKGVITEHFGFFKPGVVLFEIYGIDESFAFKIKNMLKLKTCLNLKAICNKCY
uniref:ribosomal protein L16 n=1 Tax=Bostrychia moritziana TaxID=103713 RepID=UPI002E771DC3|nr:ribosomal protein L16 [Bostrychia moritziana]WQF69385.1 ribosomal protein L16 [Bostrychia moritziana]